MNKKHEQKQIKPIVLLSTLKSPLLALHIKSLIECNLTNLYVLLDEKDVNDKDSKIWTERTQGALDDRENALYRIDKAKIPFYFVTSHNSQTSIDLIQYLEAPVLINAGTPRKLDRKLIKSASQGIINVHPGILPKYKGACCVEWSILNNDQIGNTAHFMSDEYDEGPIIEVEKYVFNKTDTYSKIRTHVYRKSIDMMTRVVSRVLSDGLMAKHGIAQEKTPIHKPISPEQLDEVKNLIKNGKYQYAI